MHRLNILFTILVLITTIGCTTLSSSYKKNYIQVSPIQYPPKEKTTEVSYFHYHGINIDDIYKIVFGNDYEIIGTSNFTGPYQDINLVLKDHSARIGADVVLYSAMNPTAKQVMYTYSVPTTTTSTVKDQFGWNRGTIKTEGTAQQVGSKTVVDFDQKALFLKNKTNLTKIWELKESDIKHENTSKFDGIWSTNIGYEIKIYRSGNRIVGVLNKDITSNNPFPIGPKWFKGDIKFIVENTNDLIGLYFKEDKAPVPTKITIDENGYLNFEVITIKEPIKMARIQQ